MYLTKSDLIRICLPIHALIETDWCNATSIYSLIHTSVQNVIQIPTNKIHNLDCDEQIARNNWTRFGIRILFISLHMISSIFSSYSSLSLSLCFFLILIPFPMTSLESWFNCGAYICTVRSTRTYVWDQTQNLIVVYSVIRNGVFRLPSSSLPISLHWNCKYWQSDYLQHFKLLNTHHHLYRWFSFRQMNVFSQASTEDTY